MRPNARIALIALCLGAAAPAAAQRTVLDFENVTCHTALRSYAFGGYQLQPFSANFDDRFFWEYCPFDSYYGGSTALLVGTSAPATVTLTSASGSFAIESMSVSYLGQAGSQSVLFVGVDRNGVTHQQEFLIPQSNPSLFQTIIFGAEFTNLTSLQWSSNIGGNLQFDNLAVINTAPEPATVALLLAGVGGLVLIRLRRGHREHDAPVRDASRSGMVTAEGCEYSSQFDRAPCGLVVGPLPSPCDPSLRLQRRPVLRRD
jgi:hypothetical protein